MSDLVARANAGADLHRRAISPVQELGAYEALWLGERATFKSIADRFRAYPGSVASDFVEPRESSTAARQALALVRDAGIEHFGVRIHGVPVSIRGSCAMLSTRSSCSITRAIGTS